jgi:hypothetical protein
MATVQVYVVRIYHAAPDGSHLRGILEDIQAGSRDQFANAIELCDILRKSYIANVMAPDGHDEG